MALPKIYYGGASTDGSALTTYTVSSGTISRTSFPFSGTASDSLVGFFLPTTTTTRLQNFVFKVKTVAGGILTVFDSLPCVPVAGDTFYLPDINTTKYRSSKEVIQTAGSIIPTVFPEEAVAGYSNNPQYFMVVVKNETGATLTNYLPSCSRITHTFTPKVTLLASSTSPEIDVDDASEMPISDFWISNTTKMYCRYVRFRSGNRLYVESATTCFQRQGHTLSGNWEIDDEVEVISDYDLALETYVPATGYVGGDFDVAPVAANLTNGSQKAIHLRLTIPAVAFPSLNKINYLKDSAGTNISLISSIMIADEYKIVARDTSTGIETILGTIPSGETELADIALDDATYEIEARGSRNFWQECRSRTKTTLKVDTGTYQSGLPDIANLKSEKGLNYTLISFDTGKESGTINYSIGIYFDTTSPVDISGVPDIQLGGGLGNYNINRLQTEQEYVAVVAYRGEGLTLEQGNVSELLLDFNSIALGNPTNLVVEG